MILKAIDIGSADSVYKMAEDNSEDTDATHNPPQCTTNQDDISGEPVLIKSSGYQAEKATVTLKCLVYKNIPWLPLIVLTIANTLLGNIYYAFSFFYIELVETFNVTYATAGWAGSIELFVSCAGGEKCMNIELVFE